MTILLQKKNFAESHLEAGITDIETSLVVHAGDGAKFPSLSGSQAFMAVIFGASYASPAQDSTREIIKVTARSTDTFTIVREQEGTTKKAWSANDKIAHILTAATITEMENELITKEGWVTANESWTYASATTITVPAGAASKYNKGDKIKLTQIDVKYFYIVAVADTVLTITGGSDYTLADAAITDNYYSKIENPLGFPYYFNYTPTGPTNTTMNGRFCLKGTKASCWINAVLTGAPDWTNMPTLPVTASSNQPGVYNNYCQINGVGGYLDAGTANRSYCIGPRVITSATRVDIINAEGAYPINRMEVSATIPITWANGDIWYVQFEYEI